MCFRCGIIKRLRPPESFFESNIGNNYPDKFDSWSLGIMIIEIFTGGYLKKNIPEHVDSWVKQVYPVLFKVLKVSKFCNHLQSNPLQIVLDKEISRLTEYIEI